MTRTMLEDVCWHGGMMISPAHFRRYLLPCYQELTRFLRGFPSVVCIGVDSDGDVGDLIPLLLEGGVNTLLPFEVQAGNDVVAIRKRFGERLVIRGGIDKRTLFYGRAEIEAELKRIMPVVETGGYIPTIDHAIPPDVPYANMLYYWEQKKRLLGIGGDNGQD